MKKIIKILEWILFILFLIIILFCSNKLSIILGIIAFIAAYLIGVKVNCNEKIFLVVLFIIGFIIRLVSLNLDISLFDDFKTMYNASISLINNNLDFVNSNYFMMFPYQLGHVIYQSILLSIINSISFLKIINYLVCSISICFIYLIGREISNDKSARVISIFYLFYLYPVYLSNILTNQFVSTLIILIVLYLIIKVINSSKFKFNNINKFISTRNIIIMGILLGISNIFRPEAIVIIGSLILFSILFITKSNYKYIIKYDCLLVLSYFIFISLCSFILYLSPINSKFTNNEGGWKFYCGLNYTHNGLYNEDDQNTYFNSKDKNKLIIDRIHNTNIKLPILFLKKEVILYTNGNYDIRINNINYSVLSKLEIINIGVLNLVLVLFVLSLFPYKDSIKNNGLILLKVIIGTYSFVYMFIEISPRYAYILHIFIFIICSYGISRYLKFDNS